MLISEFTSVCKQKGKLFQNGRLFIIEQNLSQHSDFITVSWMINELNNGKKVTFIAFRQNYAHYLSLSKKLGKSIEQFLKSKQLSYIECFQNSYCSELPLTQTSPNSYISAPTTVKRIRTDDIHKQKNLISEQNSTVIVDSISFIEQNQTIFAIFEEAMEKNCRLILGGAMQGSQMVKIFRNEADLYLKIENDVGNHGRIRVIGNSFQINLLWKHQLGKFQVSQHMKV